MHDPAPSPLPSQNREFLSPRDDSQVLACARALSQAVRANEARPLLRGKNIALLCEQDIDTAEASLFSRAAQELGVQVAHVRCKLNGASTAQEIRDMARLLSRLYDAVDCQGSARALVAQLGRDAGIPVYDGLAGVDHPSSRLVEGLEDDAPPGDKRRFVIQAVLLHTLA